jgi:hypothetical protein
MDYIVYEINWLPPFFFLTSCSTIKIKDYSNDYTQEVGKIESMNIKNTNINLSK